MDMCAFHGHYFKLGKPKQINKMICDIREVDYLVISGLLLILTCTEKPCSRARSEKWVLRHS